MPKFNIPTEKYPIHFYYIKKWFTLELHEDFIVMKRHNQYFYIEKSSGFNPFNDTITSEYLEQFEFKELSVEENDYIKLLKPLEGEINPLRKKYKISNALRGGKEEPYFTNDKDAWEYLRQIFIENPCYIALWRKEKFEIGINNPEEYCEMYNRKYGPRPIGNGTDDAILLDPENPIEIGEVWIPVLSGLTSHEYNVKTLKN